MDKLRKYNEVEEFIKELMKDHLDIKYTMDLVHKYTIFQLTEISEEHNVDCHSYSRLNLTYNHRNVSFIETQIAIMNICKKVVEKFDHVYIRQVGDEISINYDR